MISLAVCYCIAVAVHLIDSITWRIVSSSQCVDFVLVLFCKFVVIADTIFSIKKVSQLKSIGFADGKHNVGAIVGCCCMHFAT